MLMTMLIRMPPQENNNNNNFHLGVFLGGEGVGEGGLKGNLDGADGIAALFKESLCMCAASCWFSNDGGGGGRSNLQFPGTRFTNRALAILH